MFSIKFEPETNLEVANGKLNRECGLVGCLLLLNVFFFPYLFKICQLSSCLHQCIEGRSSTKILIKLCMGADKILNLVTAFFPKSRRKLKRDLYFLKRNWPLCDSKVPACTQAKL